jgi:hypothetical protein
MVIRAFIILIVISLTLFVAVFQFNKFKTSPIKYVVYFIGYVFISETIANSYLSNGMSTVIINNVYSIAYTFFNLFFYSILIKNNRAKKIGNIMMFIFSIGLLINQLFFQEFEHKLQTYTFILGLFLVTILVFIYLSEIMNSDKIFKLTNTSEFWISIGIIIFNFGFIPVLVVAELIRWEGIYNYILLFVNVIMYSCFITGFIISKREYNI